MSKYPRGKIHDDDEGEIQFRLGSDPDRHKVILDFGKPVAWLGMGPADAERLAEQLIKHAKRARGQHVDS